MVPKEIDALSVVKKIGELYQVEAQARQEKMDAATRMVLRLQKSIPVIAELKGQIQKLQQKALTKSAMGRTCNYALDQWDRLQVYLKDGTIEVDNNNCEQGIRPVALGLKN